MLHFSEMGLTTPSHGRDEQCSLRSSGFDTSLSADYHVLNGYQKHTTEGKAR